MCVSLNLLLLMYFYFKDQIRSTSVHFSPLQSSLVYFGPLRSIIVRSVYCDLIGPFWFTSVLLIHFCPLWSFMSFAVYFGWFRSTMVHFYLIRSVSIYCVLFGPFWPVSVYSIHFYPLWSFSVISVYFGLFWSTLVHFDYFGPFQSISRQLIK